MRETFEETSCRRKVESEEPFGLMGLVPFPLPALSGPIAARKLFVLKPGSAVHSD
jgi:hypothetical protein